MSKDKTVRALNREIEQLRRSVEMLGTMPEINLQELYVAKKCVCWVFVTGRWSDGTIRDI